MRAVRRNVSTWPNTGAKTAFGSLFGLFAARTGLFEKAALRKVPRVVFSRRLRNLDSIGRHGWRRQPAPLRPLPNPFDQWLRNWFAGGPDAAGYANRDRVVRSSPEKFAADLRQAWQNAENACAEDAKSAECAMATATNDARAAVSCPRKGACDCLLKPVDPEELRFAPRRTLERKRPLEIVHQDKRPQPVALDNPKAFPKIVARSPKTSRVLKEAEPRAASDAPILIYGKSGTGKELPARAVHEAGSRSKTPFVAANMASLTVGLFEAEFFGHAKGAFTKANRERAGFLKTADRGALFLDEIGSLSAEMLPESLRRRKTAKQCLVETGEDGFAPLREMEREYILKACRSLYRNKSKTARILGVGLDTLRRRLESYGED